MHSDVHLTEVDYDPFATPELARAVPTTDAQRELWLADQLGREASLAFNESVSLDIRGTLRVQEFQDSLLALSDRHESLRSTIAGDGMNMLIAPRGALLAEIVDLSGQSAAEQEREAARRREATVMEPFDLVHGPLVRATLLCLAPDRHEFILSAHHIVCDGWSFAVLARDLMRIYAGLCSGRGTADLPQVDSFGDYALGEHDPALAEQATADERYWVSVFDRGVPTLDLPTDRPRRSVRSFASRREDFRIEPALVEAARKLGAANGASLFATLFGLFGALMSRLGADESGEVVVGVPSAGQAARDANELVGHCVNLLPVRMAVDPAEPVGALLRRASTAVLDAYEHQSCTFGRLLSKLAITRDASRLPLVSVQFNIDSPIAPADLAAPGVDVSLRANPRAFENFELFVNATQTGGAIVLECQYNTDLFDAETVQRWLDLYREVLERAVAQPTQAVGQLFGATRADRERLAAFNATAMPYPADQRIEALVSAQVARTPDAVAIVAGDSRLTYRELEQRANAVAAALAERGVGAGQLVGMACGRNVGLLAGMLGILKTGAAYVPLDPAFPEERLVHMAEDAALACVVTDRTVTLPALARFPTLHVDELAPRADCPCEARDVQAAAYVIYTSGSTGKPKGVAVPQRAVSNFLASMAREPGLRPDDRLVAVTTTSFDIAVLELFLPLTLGAQVIIADRDSVLDGQRLRALIEKHDATVLQATPSGWRVLIEAGWVGHGRFKALVGGEPLGDDLAEQLIERTGETWNMYGPTETTVWSTCWRVPRQRQGIRIGAPIANTQIHVLDARFAPCPIGVPGEIFIGGDGVAIGYLKREELTAERFIADPAAPGERIYRTGDRGRWRNDGLLEHMGRLDFQVKVRG
ncbi:MAG: amino acid adenylation domain-containing protein, partial [Proteobacteria bacterium]|nr:amino acid adenylation domain-containing protein [Pseudomonadota bacterium]